MSPERDFAIAKELDEFVEALDKFRRGVWTPDQWKAFRLTRGIYGQRQPNTQMVRVKVPQGVLSARQLERLGEVASAVSRGFGHITTRENIQFHFVKLDNVPQAIERLHEVGLTTREACGNTVRNVVTCPFAGVCRDEPFDVTPYGEAITRHFLRNSICQALPRKFKITLSGCGNDCASAAINDIGLIARTRHVGNGNIERGFEMRVGGGLSASPEDAHKIADFVPADELLARAEAVVRVFERTGNRENKARARLKFVIRRLGIDGFMGEFERELAAIRAAGRLVQPIEGKEEEQPRRRGGTEIGEGEGVGVGGEQLAFAEWRRTNVKAQKQDGYLAVTVRLPLGDLTTAQFKALAVICARHGDGTVRTAIDQNVVMRWVREESLAAVHRDLVAANMGLAGAHTILDVTSCPGADTCNLAVTASRELANEIDRRLEESPETRRLVQIGESLKIKISGCPNSCGQHHIAAFGFSGGVKKIDGRAVPDYQLHLAGGVDADRAVFGREVVKIPARRVSEAVVRLLKLYDERRNAGEAPLAFFRRVSDDEVRATLRDLVEISAANARNEDYQDLGSDKPFVVDIGIGECAA